MVLFYRPDSGQPLELGTGTSPDDLARRAEHRIDDEVVDHRQVVKEGHVIAAELETGDQKLKGLSGNLAVTRMNKGLLDANT